MAVFSFKKPKNELEVFMRAGTGDAPAIPEEMFKTCPGCRASLTADELGDNLRVCPKCGYHFPVNARERIHLIVDEGSFIERDADLRARNIIDFPEYDVKLTGAANRSGEPEAVVTGECRIAGHRCALFAMEGEFMMGSMGVVVGEKITRIFEYATEQSLPVVGFTVSGGARMQEGILSLMQMAKTSGAVREHGQAGNLYVVVLTNPTTGGVTASFAMEGDIIISEPGALICFAGPRVIEQTTRQKLPPGFQKAEFLLEKGFIDEIVPRPELRLRLGGLLKFHAREAAQ